LGPGLTEFTPKHPDHIGGFKQGEAFFLSPQASALVEAARRYNHMYMRMKVQITGMSV
jgi:hypothetical protein